MWCSLLVLAVSIFTPAILMAQQPDRNAVLSSSECGVLRPDQFYNLEKSVADNEFPWMASLLNSNNQFICLSVLIAKQYAVAAAHCPSSVKGDLTLDLGNCKKQSQCSVKIEVQTFVIYPSYELPFYDISVLRLKEPVTISDYVRPICLPNADVAGNDFAAQHLTMTGKQFLGGQNSKHTVLVVDRNRCLKLLRSLVIDDRMLCANTCDNGSKYISGSALLGVSMNNTMPYRYYLLGFFTFGMSHCSDSTPDIFQRIDRYMDWIEETVVRLEQPLKSTFPPAILMDQQPDRKAVLSSSECGVLRPDQFYNLEKSVADNEFPWMASLLNSNNQFICLSVLIAKQYAVAAAHCPSSVKGDLTLDLGNCKKQSQCSVKIEVQTFVIYPSYELPFYDISVLRLKEPVTISDYVRPICLPNADVAGNDFAAQHLTMTGKQFLGGQNSKHTVLVVDRNRCLKLLRSLVIDDRMLCANTCDNGSKYISGSALLGVSMNNTMPYRYYLLGFFTFGMSHCSDSTPDIFQRIDRYMDWIEETVIRLEQT